LLIPGCIVSYGSTMFLFLPCLFLLSLWRPLTGLKVCLLGLVLGGAVLIPLTVMAWKSSGADSGPPTESFFTFFVRWTEDPLTAVFPLAGLITAGLYWWLGRGRGAARYPHRLLQMNIQTLDDRCERRAHGDHFARDLRRSDRRWLEADAAEFFADPGLGHDLAQRRIEQIDDRLRRR